MVKKAKGNTGHKGTSTVADPLDFKEYKRLVEGLREKKLFVWELYCVLGFCTALRVSDILELTWFEIINKNLLIVTEKKTGKTRRIPLNETVRKRLKDIYSALGSPDQDCPVIMNPKTLKAYTSEHINRTLKKFIYKFKLKIKNFSTHTFRKTFGRYTLDKATDKTEALLILNFILCHSSLEITKGYLGLRDDTKNSIFQSIEI